MALKRGRSYYSHRVGKYKRRRGPLRTVSRTRPVYKKKTRFAKKVMRVVNTYSEEKNHMMELADNMVIKHNTVQLISDNAFLTNVGNTAEQKSNAGAGTRIGRKIYAKGIACSLIIESQQYRPNVDYWIMLVRNKSDPDTKIETKAMMYEGVSDQIPTDYLDPARCHVMYSKKIKPRMPNPGIDDAMNISGAGGISDGNAHNATGGRSIPNPKTLMKFYVPLKKNLTFRDYTENVTDSRLPLAAQRYQWVIVAYNNNSSIGNGGTWPCGHLWFTTKFKFSDV